jgi:hypothetical protein
LALSADYQKFAHEAIDITTVKELTLPDGWETDLLDVYAVADGKVVYNYYDSGDPDNNIQFEFASDVTWEATYGHCVLQEAWQPPDADSGFNIIGIRADGGFVCDEPIDVEEGERIGFVSRCTYYLIRGGHCHFEIFNECDMQCVDPLLCDRMASLTKARDDSRPCFFEDEPEGRVDDEDELIGYKIPVDDKILLTCDNNMILYWETLSPDGKSVIKSRQTLKLNANGYEYWEDYLEDVTDEDHRIFTTDSEVNIRGYLGDFLLYTIQQHYHNTYLYIDHVPGETEFWIRAYDAYGRENKILIPNDNIAPIPFVASIEEESGEGKAHLEIVENGYFDERARFSIYNGGVADGYLLTDEPIPFIRGKDNYQIGSFVKTSEDTAFYSLLIEVPGDGNYVFRIEGAKCECIDWYK